jgi:cytochrome c oxidase subunit 2
MRLLVIADDGAAFDAWQRRQLAPASVPVAGGAAHGESVFRDQACGNCHAIAGRGFNGRAAPDLTHMASRTTLGAGVAQNTPAELAAWLRDPQTIKPGSKMPDFKLSQANVDDLAAYLGALQ